MKKGQYKKHGDEEARAHVQALMERNLSSRAIAAVLKQVKLHRSHAWVCMVIKDLSTGKEVTHV